MNIEDIKVGDTVTCKRTIDHGYLNGANIDKSVEFSGLVERIVGDVIYLNTPASVRIDKVIKIESK